MIKYENKTLILPVRVYKRGKPFQTPHILQIAPKIEYSSIIRVGEFFVLDFPDDSRFECMSVGVVYATPNYCCLALVVLVGEQLDLAYLVLRRELLHAQDFPPLILWEGGEPHWFFYSSFDIHFLCLLLCYRTSDPRRISEIFLQKWGSLVTEHQNLILGPKELAFANRVSSVLLVSLGILLCFLNSLGILIVLTG